MIALGIAKGSSTVHQRKRQTSILSTLVIGTFAALTGQIGYIVGLSQACRNDFEHVAPLIRIENKCPVCHSEQTENDQPPQRKEKQRPTVPSSISSIAVGMSRVSREDFANMFDVGVPLQQTSPGNEHVLLLHSQRDALPRQISHHHNTSITQEENDAIPLITSAREATANCDYLNIVLTSVDSSRRQCIAIMGQHEAYHVQRWMRPPSSTGKVGAVDYMQPLGAVPRFYLGGSGLLPLLPPSSRETRRHWDVLQQYFGRIDFILEQLRPLAEKAARKNTLVIMFSNHGQSELLINFCCNARARKLDLSAVLIFATDMETKELADGLGLTAFYDEPIFGRLPSKASVIYGDDVFRDMMKAKVMCIQVASMLGYDILFQDADVVWFRDPMPYFHSKTLSHFDILIADDGNFNPQ